MAPPAAGDNPPPPAEESSASTEESRWTASLSERELDLLISLKMLAVRRAETAGRPHLADAFDLRTLRALGVVLLEDFKQRLREETSLDATGLDRLALSRHPVTGGGGGTSDAEVFRWRSKDQPIKLSGVKENKSRCKMGKSFEYLASCRGCPKDQEKKNNEREETAAIIKSIAKIFLKLERSSAASTTGCR